MGGVLLSLYFLFLKWFVIIIKAEETNITFPFILNETDMKNFNKTAVLRYGFHRTDNCLDFQKTYVCIRSCLTSGFDIAAADRNCECTCFKDKIKSKYFGANFDWKIPTTTMPAWVKDSFMESKDVFVLVHSVKNEKLKHEMNESLLESNETEMYGNNSSEEHLNETHSDGENEDGDAEDGGTDNAEPGSGDDEHGSGEENHNETHSAGENDDGDAEGGEAENDDAGDEDTGGGEAEEEAAERRLGWHKNGKEEKNQFMISMKSNTTSQKIRKDGGLLL